MDGIIILIIIVLVILVLLMCYMFMYFSKGGHGCYYNETSAKRYFDNYNDYTSGFYNVSSQDVYFKLIFGKRFKEIIDEKHNYFDYIYEADKDWKALTIGDLLNRVIGLFNGNIQKATFFTLECNENYNNRHHYKSIISDLVNISELVKRRRSFENNTTFISTQICYPEITGNSKSFSGNKLIQILI